ncbi:MAG TPA: Npun_R2821/Npun_R2822 family protein [Cyanophyceae cyanobacterium]
MSCFGIYTLANDAVYDQLVALLNSIEVNVSADIPVCIIPYDDRMSRVRQEVDSRANITIFDNWESIQRWENFAREVWAAYSQSSQKKSAQLVRGRCLMQRRYAAFDGSFDKFVVYDADCLAMKPLDSVLKKLDVYDLVFDDWEHSKPDPVTALNLPFIEKSTSLSAAKVRSQLHCASFFGSKRGLFDRDQLSTLKEKLTKHREIEWINGVSEAFLFNYMTVRGEYSIFNFTLSPDGQDRTGNCADADPFLTINNVLYNEEGLKPIHRIHYMNYSAVDFARLCQGEDVDIRYKDIFLYYRFLKSPEQRPKQLNPPSWLEKNSRKLKQMRQKIKVPFSTLFQNKFR